jgi:hypothetical protein
MHHRCIHAIRTASDSGPDNVTHSPSHKITGSQKISDCRLSYFYSTQTLRSDMQSLERSAGGGQLINERLYIGCGKSGLVQG